MDMNPYYGKYTWIYNPILAGEQNKKRKAKTKREEMEVCDRVRTVHENNFLSK